MAQGASRPSLYVCRRCGWTGQVNGQRRCKACARRWASEWRRAHPDRAAAMKAAWCTTEKGIAYLANHKRTQRANNPETTKAAYERRMAWLRSGDVTPEELRAIYQESLGRCHYCGCLVERPRFASTELRGFDHVIPRIQGGKHTASNMVVCCKLCNARKAKEDVRG